LLGELVTNIANMGLGMIFPGGPTVFFSRSG